MMGKKKSNTTNTDNKDAVLKMIMDNSEITNVLGENLIITTEDKLKLCLMTYDGHIKDKYLWLTYFGIFISITLALFTTNFRDLSIFGMKISQYTVQAAFVISDIIFFALAIFSLKKCFKAPTIDSLITEIKNGTMSKKDSGNYHPSWILSSSMTGSNKNQIRFISSNKDESTK